MVTLVGAVVAILVAAFALAPRASTSPGLRAAIAPGPTVAAAPVDRVYLIVLENHSDAGIRGTPEAPFLNGLMARYGSATDYRGVAHPSQPNYFMLTSGSTQGVTDDANHDVNAPNLFDQLDAAGRSWHVYAQDFPGGCFTGADAGGGVDLAGAPGPYARKHVPAISYTTIAQSPDRCAAITSLSSFDPAAANFELIVPNEMNNMHDGSIAQADQFLAAFVPRIIDSSAFATGVLFITFDEGTSAEGGGGIVPLVVVRPGIASGLVSPVTHTHASLLRTIEDAFGLPCLAAACDVDPMGEFFGR